MSLRARYEAIWEALPRGLEPADFALRRDFLLSQVRPGQRVLDLGCGEGAFAQELTAAGTQVLAADVAQEPLRRARERVADLDTVLLGSDRWALEDSSFDAVWAGELIEHVADTAAWLSEVRRVLRSGGQLLLSTPAHGRLTMLRLVLLGPAAFGERFDPLSDHLRFYSGASLTALLESFGFEDVRVRHAGGPPGARRLLLARAVRARF